MVAPPFQSPIQVQPSQVGFVKVANIHANSIQECNRLLQKNHEQFHMFFRDRAGHNHIAHSLLTILSLGATPEELRDRFEDGVPIQRPIPKIDYDTLEKLGDSDFFYNTLGEITQYHTFLEFFKREMATRNWKDVVQKYVFARTKVADAMLARLYEGAYHPIIHFGLGVEFQQPTIVAEGLAQAAAHDDSHISKLFFDAEKKAAAVQLTVAGSKSLIDLIHEVRADDTIRNGPQWSDLGNKMRDGVVGRAGAAMSTLASNFRIQMDEEDLRRKTAEMISTCAYFAGASQHAGRKRKIDFFYMHTVTSSLFFQILINQDWIKLEDRVRLVEWKGRLDLAWYAVSGSPALDVKSVTDYSNVESDGMDWEALFNAVIKEHDDGHAAKFIRALRNGEQVCGEYEVGDLGNHFPMKGIMWLNLARMCQDTTKGLETDLKWVPFTGFPQPWGRPDLVN